jgi:hypothetical protein
MFWNGFYSMQLVWYQRPHLLQPTHWKTLILRAFLAGGSSWLQAKQMLVSIVGGEMSGSPSFSLLAIGSEETEGCVTCNAIVPTNPADSTTIIITSWNHVNIINSWMFAT